MEWAARPTEATAVRIADAVNDYLDTSRALLPPAYMAVLHSMFASPHAASDPCAFVRGVASVWEGFPAVRVGMMLRMTEFVIHAVAAQLAVEYAHVFWVAADYAACAQQQRAEVASFQAVAPAGAALRAEPLPHPMSASAAVPVPAAHHGGAARAAVLHAHPLEPGLTEYELQGARILCGLKRSYAI